MCKNVSTTEFYTLLHNYPLTTVRCRLPENGIYRGRLIILLGIIDGCRFGIGGLADYPECQHVPIIRHNGFNAGGLIFHQCTNVKLVCKGIGLPAISALLTTDDYAIQYHIAAHIRAIQAGYSSPAGTRSWNSLRAMPPWATVRVHHNSSDTVHVPLSAHHLWTIPAQRAYHPYPYRRK